jgi:hypothetical protein
MRTITKERFEKEIDNTLELTSVCRGDWCRELEGVVDGLRVEWNEINGGITLNYGQPRDQVSRKIRAAYRNLGPDIHV